MAGVAEILKLDHQTRQELDRSGIAAGAADRPTGADQAIRL
jgi:hypothetical protein